MNAVMYLMSVNGRFIPVKLVDKEHAADSDALRNVTVDVWRCFDELAESNCFIFDLLL